MTATIERIRKEASQLPFDEREALVRVLELDLDSESDEATPEVEAAWDAEIAERVKDVEEGRVQLISGEEFQRNTDALFAELGIKRLA